VKAAAPLVLASSLLLRLKADRYLRRFGRER
jgi:hypothetical protein